MENLITIIMAIIFAIIFLMIALRNKFSNRHLLGEIERLKAQLTEAENEKDALMDKIAKPLMKVA